MENLPVDGGVEPFQRVACCREAVLHVAYYRLLFLCTRISLNLETSKRLPGFIEVPLGIYGRWAFAECKDVCAMELASKLKSKLNLTRSSKGLPMKTELIHTLTTTFEAHAQQAESGVEFWLARDLQYLLGYSKWENFLNVVSKAKTACEISGHHVPDHFPGVRKMVDLGSGSQREVDDLMLTRYACYLIAQNGDPKKQEIAFAQAYFAVQTRKAELIEQRLLEAERVSARKKLTATEKELSDVIYEQTGGNQNFALIRSKGDQALFGKTTQTMKSHWKKTSPPKSPSSMPGSTR